MTLNERILAGVRQQLSDNDYRLTPQRQVVLGILVENSNTHLSADDIYLKAKEVSPDIGLATVYRTLELFDKLGIVYRLDYGDGQARYEFNDGLERHYHHHLICLGCGRIQEFNDDLLEDVEQAIATKAGFHITDHCLRFFGYCSNCRPPKEQNPTSRGCSVPRGQNPKANADRD